MARESRQAEGYGMQISQLDAAWSTPTGLGFDAEKRPGRGTVKPVDVLTEIEIDRPRHEVASYAADPENATAWYENIERIEWKTVPSLGLGSRVAFVAQFLGRRIAYTYEVVELVPDERLVMRTVDGPFPMETTYTWSDTTSGGTRMTLRNCGRASGFSKLAAPMMTTAMRRANRKDLERLKQILESPSD
jgi:uncharacterized protein YndB with AHSA1/START domain